MKAYNPQVQVFIHRHHNRTEIVPGVKVGRSQLGSESTDITAMLGEGSRVTCTKSVRGPGSFSITFPDQKDAVILDSLYALIPPMSMIEIFMSHDTERDKVGNLPIVFRGLVDSVTRTESMSGGKPSRGVIVSGTDLTKLLQIYFVNYKLGSEANNFALQDFRFFHAYAHEAPRTLSANAFVELCVRDLINPFINNIRALSDHDGFDGKNILNWSSLTSLTGSINGTALNSVDNENVYDIMRMLLDAPNFNELFVRDNPHGTTLVARPIPAKYAGSGEFIQGSADSLDISSNDIISQSSTLTDNNVANFYWVTSSRMSMLLDRDEKTYAYAGDKSTFITKDYENTSLANYGFRSLQVETTMSDDEASWAYRLRADELNKEAALHTSWVTSRRVLLAELNKDNLIFESGQLTMKGQHEIQPGTYLRVHRGVNQVFVGEVYAHSVTHDFQPFVGYFSVISYDRGTFWQERTKSQDSLYILETESGIHSDIKNEQPQREYLAEGVVRIR